MSNPGTLKEELAAIASRLEKMRQIKCQRKSDFDIVRREHIRLMSGSTTFVYDETNLSLGQLKKLHTQLHSLRDNLKNQLPGIEETLFPLCEVLGLDYDRTHEKEAGPFYFYDDSKPGDWDITKDTIDNLTATIHKYQELKKLNMEKLQRLATKILELWDFLGTPDEEQLTFQHFRHYVAASEHEMTEPVILSSASLECVEMEVSRLQALKSIRCGKTESVRVDAEVDPSLCENEGAKRLEMVVTSVSHLTDLGSEKVTTSVSHLIDLATTILKLWDALDTPIEERQLFQECSLFVEASEGKITEYVVPKRFLVSLWTESNRLELMRSSRLKGDVLKKKLEWQKICKETDIVAEPEYDQWDEYIKLMDAGDVNPQYLSDKLDRLIATAEKVRCRNDIRNSVKEWLLAQEEVSWLKAYEKDLNRYIAGSANRTLKRAERDHAERAHAEEARAERARAEEARAERAHAERARALAIQLEMVKELDSKATSWEKKNGVDLTYDGIRVLSLLKEPAILKRKRKLDQKKPLSTSSKRMPICAHCQLNAWDV